MSNWTIKGPFRIVEHSWEETSVYDAEGDVLCNIRISDNATEETQDYYEQITAAKANAIAQIPGLIDATKALINYCADHGWGEIPEPGVTLQRVLSVIYSMEGSANG
jgi:hypothetical protein